MALKPTIAFDKDVFFPGDEITGKIEMKLTKDLSARKIEIKFINETVTGWTRDGKPVSSAALQKGNEVHLQVTHQVWTPEDEKNILPAGEYEWNFSFELPKDTQPTFESNFGCIRYVVGINIDVPHFLDEHRESAVTVATQLNLNDIPNITDPVKFQAKEEMICCDFINFIKKGNVQFTIQVPKSGYVAGETIHVQGLIENHLKAKIRAIRGALVRKTVTKSDPKNTDKNYRKNPNVGGFDELHNKLDRVLFGAVEEVVDIPIGADHEFSFNIAIPAIAPTIRNNSHIHVEYAVQIAAIADSMCIVESLGEAPIIIGTVPIGGRGELSYVPSARGDLDTQCAADAIQRFGDKFVPKYPIFKNL